MDFSLYRPYLPEQHIVTFPVSCHLDFSDLKGEEGENCYNSFCHKYFVNIMLIFMFMERSDSGLCYQVCRWIQGGRCSCSEKTPVSLLTVSWVICLKIEDQEMTLTKIKAASFILVPLIRIWTSPICQLLRLGSLYPCLFCLSARYILNLHYHGVTLPKPYFSAPYISLVSSALLQMKQRHIAYFVTILQPLLVHFIVLYCIYVLKEIQKA